MARISVSRSIAAPHHLVWAALADLGSHSGWMRDVRSIEFLGNQRRGVGTRFQVKTVLGPFRTLDVMEVVGWEEGSAVEVLHQGLVTGQGRLSARPHGAATLVQWEETISFPWWLGGAVTAWLAKPLLANLWLDNLARLEEGLVSS